MIMRKLAQTSANHKERGKSQSRTDQPEMDQTHDKEHKQGNDFPDRETKREGGPKDRRFMMLVNQCHRRSADPGCSLGDTSNHAGGHEGNAPRLEGGSAQGNDCGQHGGQADQKIQMP